MSWAAHEFSFRGLANVNLQKKWSYAALHLLSSVISTCPPSSVKLEQCTGQRDTALCNVTQHASAQHSTIHADMYVYMCIRMYTHVYAYTYSLWTVCIVCRHCAQTRLPEYSL